MFLFRFPFQSTVNDKIKELITECCSKCSALPDTLKVNEDVLKFINPSAEQWENVIKTLQKVEVKKPAALPTVVEPNANVTFATVGGLDEQVKYLRENIIAPLKEKDVLKEWGVEPVRGIIFYGPPVIFFFLLFFKLDISHTKNIPYLAGNGKNFTS